MKCKDFVAGILKEKSAAEWIQHLGAERIREAFVVDAICLRELSRGHIERPKQEIPDRERPGEVLGPASIRGRMVPAVEDWSRNDGPGRIQGRKRLLRFARLLKRLSASGAKAKRRLLQRHQQWPTRSISPAMGDNRIFIGSLGWS